MPTVPAAGYPTGPDAPPQMEPAPFGQPQDFLRIDARPEAFGAQVGGALSEAGRRGEQGAGELFQAAISRQEFFNSVAADNASTEYMKESHKIFYGDPDAGVNPVTGQANKPGFFALKGQDAINAGSPNDQLDELQKRIAANLPNDRARLQFNTETRRLRTYTDGEISRHWDEQLKTAGDATLAAKGDLHERDAATYFNDPVRFNSILEEGRNDITSRTQIKLGTNAAPAVLADARAQEDAKLYGSAIRAATAAGNLERAEQLKNEALARGIFTGEQAHEAEQLIEPKRNQQVGKDLGRAAFGGGGGGQFTAPPGAPIAGATPDEQQMLNEIRARESTTNYTSIGPVAKGQGHFGAYQFDPSTWQDAAAGTGLGKEYATADKAPKEIQDANALWLLRNRGTQPWAASGPYPAMGKAGGGGQAGPAVAAITKFATGSAAPGGPSPVTGLREDFAQRILTMTEAMPPEIRAKFEIDSGYRSQAREEEVYATQHPGQPVPQHSRHTDGSAADIGNDPAVINWITNHPEFGLGFPLAAQHGEANHMEMVGAVRVAGGGQMASAAPTTMTDATPAAVAAPGALPPAGAATPSPAAPAAAAGGPKVEPTTFMGMPAFLVDGVPYRFYEQPSPGSWAPAQSGVKGTPEAAAAAEKAAKAAKPQTVSEGGIIHNPKTGEYLQNVGGKLVRYMPPGV